MSAVHPVASPTSKSTHAKLEPADSIENNSSVDKSFEFSEPSKHIVCGDCFCDRDIYIMLVFWGLWKAMCIND